MLKKNLNTIFKNKNKVQQEKTKFQIKGKEEIIINFRAFSYKHVIGVLHVINLRIIETTATVMATRNNSLNLLCVR